VAPDALQNLVATTEYFAFNANINNSKSVGTPSCAGCTTPACIVLNSINVVAGTISNQLLGAGTSAGSNFANYGAAGPDCLLVPVKNTTWSHVKTLYH